MIDARIGGSISQHGIPLLEESFFMSEEAYRVLEVHAGRVHCRPDREETIEHCRFCVFSRSFKVRGRQVTSPALAYCLRHRATEEVNLKEVEAVTCADRMGEGYRSMMNIIG
jgi:hypothetical protein